MTHTTTAGERRTRTAPVKFRAELRSDGKLRLAGTAAVFDSPSEDLGFREVLVPGCFSKALDKGDPVFLLWQHRSDSPLAKTGAGLKVWESRDGLEFEAELADTSVARDAVELARSGVVDSMSFAFSMEGGKDTWTTRNGERWRYVNSIGHLFEVSMVSQPAYTATSVGARGSLERELAEVRAKAAARTGRLAVREPSPYQPDGQFSYFRDLLTVAKAEGRYRDAADRGVPHLPADHMVPGGDLPNPVHGGLTEARDRLTRLDETRDLTSTATAGGGFIPTGVPAHVADAFATAARSKAVLAGLLPNEPLPETGLTVDIPVFSTGASVAIHTENTTVSETDPATGTATSPVGLVSGLVDLSQQLLDRSAPGMDVALGAELGAALGANVDSLLLVGTGTKPQPLGLLSVASTTSVSYTDTTATQAELWVKITDAFSQGATALGAPPDLAILAPRRGAWLSNWRDSATGMQAVVTWPGTPPMAVSLVPAIPTNLGASTSEDVILLLRRDDLPVFVGPVNVRVAVGHAGSGTLTPRVIADVYVATGFGRQPKAITKVVGTGLTVPSFT